MTAKERERNRERSCSSLARNIKWTRLELYEKINNTVVSRSATAFLCLIETDQETNYADVEQYKL